MLSNQQLADDEASGADDHQLREAAECLRRYLLTHGKTNQLHDILRYLAEQTLVRLREGKPPHFNYHTLQSAVVGRSNKDPSAWFSPHWKNLTGEFKTGAGEGLKAFAINEGFSVYPDFDKRESEGGAGNQALVFLVARPIEADAETASRKLRLPHRDVDYIPVETIALAGWAKLLFDKNYVAEGWRKWLLISPALIWVLLLCLTGATLLYFLLQPNRPLATADLAVVIGAGLAAWFFWLRLRYLVRWVDDQIVMASESMLGFWEHGVCLELYRPQTGQQRRARIVKYAAQCPSCGAQILLDHGEPDFPRRLVGRCRNSPREHVFSFDKATLSGYRLR